MEENQFYTIILRHDTSTEWMLNNPILALGEYGVEDDTHRVKRGDGIHTWDELLYETFGIEMSVSFADISGEPEDNISLKTALDSKLNKDVYTYTDDNVLTDIKLTLEDSVLCEITKSTFNLNTSSQAQNKVIIKSNDKSIQGIWTVDELGRKILNLTSNTIIENFKPNTLYRADELCFYEDTLYKSKTDFTSGESFDENDWDTLTSNRAEDISFDNTSTDLESTNVQDSVVELNEKINSASEILQELENQMTYNEYD